MRVGTMPGVLGQQVAGGGGFALPTTNLVFRLEADSGVTMSGPNPTAWADSVQGYSLTVTGNPTMGTTPTGASCIVFDGTDDRAGKTGSSSALPGGASPRTVIVVRKMVSTADARRFNFVYGRDSASGGDRLYGLIVNDNANGNVLAVRLWTNTENSATAEPHTWGHHTSTLDGATELKQFLSGTLIDTADKTGQINTVVNNVNTVIKVACDWNDTGITHTEIAAVFIWSAVLSAGDLAQAWGWIDEKYIT